MCGPCKGLFCEDFEDGPIDAAKWDVKVGAGGMQMVQQQTVAHGKYAWHVHGTGARGDFATILTKNAPMALQGAGPVFGRAYVYATANLGAHIQLGIAGTTRSPMVAPTLTPTEGGIRSRRRIANELAKLGHDVDKCTVANTCPSRGGRPGVLR